MEGYNNKFISEQQVDLPEITNTKYKNNILPVLNYTHFSIVLLKCRRLALYTAVNINGTEYIQSNRGSDKWQIDERAKRFQIGKEFYSKTNKEFHKGHLVRRLDPCWGKAAVRKIAEENTFFFTNSTPQHKNFNPKIWLELEKHILEKGADKSDINISVFCGPILNQNDRFYYKLIDDKMIQIPSAYWKIIVWQKTDEKLYAVGFIQSQWNNIKGLLRSESELRGLPAVRRDDSYFENLKFKDGKTYQVKVTEIEKQTGLRFNWPDVTFPFKGENNYRLAVVEQQAGTQISPAMRTAADTNRSLEWNIYLG